MIDPNELCLNNVVIAPNGRMGLVKEITEHEVKVLYSDMLHSHTPQELKPVRITHELLEKCGFRLELEPPLVNEDGSIQPGEGFIWKGQVKLYLKGDQIYAGTHYTNLFHKLQNLYFFSTEDELTFVV